MGDNQGGMQAERTVVPRCIGIVMDGNRRYARAHGLPQIEGHRLGYEKVKEASQWCRDAGVAYLVLYAFSTENWNRSPEEVSYLTDLFRTLLMTEAQELQEQNVALRFIGDVDRFGPELASKARELEANNPQAPDGTLVLALSYGGRLEILSAVNKLIAEGAKPPVDEATLARAMWSAGIPDPDMIIRVGGERRLSGFLTWGSVYSELFFSDTPWPAFTREEFMQMLDEYATRERRMGK